MNVLLVILLKVLGTSSDISTETRPLFEKFICQMNISNTSIVDIVKAILWLLIKMKFYDELLPPTREALRMVIKSAILQDKIWNQSLLQYPLLPSPEEHGWKNVGNKFESIMFTNSCAPSFFLDICPSGWSYICVPKEW